MSKTPKGFPSQALPVYGGAGGSRIWEGHGPSVPNSQAAARAREIPLAVQLLSRVPLSATPWTAARQAPLFVGFSRQEHWSEVPLPSPGDLPDPGIELTSPVLQRQILYH